MIAVLRGRRKRYHRCRVRREFSKKTALDGFRVAGLEICLKLSRQTILTWTVRGGMESIGGVFQLRRNGGQSRRWNVRAAFECWGDMSSMNERSRYVCRDFDIRRGRISDES